MNKRPTKIQVCLNCPEPKGCISDDWGCPHLEKTISAREMEKAKKESEISAIRELLPQFGYLIPTKIIVTELGINRNRLGLLERQGLIQTTKIHNGRGGLRIIGVAE